MKPNRSQGCDDNKHYNKAYRDSELNHCSKFHAKAILQTKRMKEVWLSHFKYSLGCGGGRYKPVNIFVSMSRKENKQRKTLWIDLPSSSDPNLTKNVRIEMKVLSLLADDVIDVYLHG